MNLMSHEVETLNSCVARVQNMKRNFKSTLCTECSTPSPLKENILGIQDHDSIAVEGNKTSIGSSCSHSIHDLGDVKKQKLNGHENLNDESHYYVSGNKRTSIKKMDDQTSMFHSINPVKVTAKHPIGSKSNELIPLLNRNRVDDAIAEFLISRPDIAELMKNLANYECEEENYLYSKEWSKPLIFSRDVQRNVSSKTLEEILAKHPDI